MINFIEKHKVSLYFLSLTLGSLFVIDAISSLGYIYGYVEWDSWDQFFFRNQPTVFFYPDWWPGIPIFGTLGIALVGFAVWVRKRFN